MANSNIMISFCNVCSKNVRSFQYHLDCLLCNSQYHYQCLNRNRNEYDNACKTDYFCTKCISHELPYNHFDDDYDFFNAISENWYNTARIDFRQLDERCFIPFEVNDKYNTHIPLCDVDPDRNFFNETYNIKNVKCDYHVEDSFIDYINKYELRDALSIYHMNARSFLPKKTQLIQYLESLECNFKVIGVSETWLTNDSLPYASLDQYKCEHTVRPPGLVGGGVSIYVHDSIDYGKRLDLTMASHDIETCFVEIDKTSLSLNKNVLVGCIYRPPGRCAKEFNNHMKNILEIISHENKIGYIMGDYNLNLLNNESHKQTNEFLDVMYGNAFIPVITKSTRITSHTATLIDNIFTNNTHSDRQQYPGLLYNDISDHLPIFCFDKNITVKQETLNIKKRTINDVSIQKFKEKLDQTDWTNLRNISDAQDAYTCFIYTFRKIYNNCFPLKSIKIYRNLKKPWITQGIRSSIKTKNKLYAMKLKMPSPLRISTYNKFRNKLNHLINTAERNYYREKFDQYKNNLNKSWKIIKEVIGRNKSKPQLCKQFEVNGTKIEDSKIISNKFNDYFVGIGDSMAKKIQPSIRKFSEYLSGSYMNSFYLNPTTEEEIDKIINSFKDSACGWDDIASKVIKKVRNQITNILVHLCNLSFVSGFVPTELKLAKVVPVFKSGNKDNFTNYRPISVLCIFSKIYERLAYNRLLNFLLKNNALFKYQFGFRDQHSTELALILLIDKITSAIDNNEFTLAVFLDLSKAFDMVNHSILLNKLEHYGIRGVPLQWFRSYLNERKQYVSFNGTDSTSLDIKCGVPQGSILGPLLFLIFINDLHNASKSLFFILFADDSNLLLSGPNINDLCKQMNQEIKAVVEWFKVNQLCLNISKTNFMIFSAKNKIYESSNYNIQVENITVEQVKQTKFLGVYIDDKLNWSVHINYICNKISKNIGVITRARKMLDQKTTTGLYYTFIYPYLNYCCSVWGLAPATYVSKLQILQKRILRIICGKPRLSPSLNLFISLKILPIVELNKLKLATFCYKFQSQMLPSIFNEYITSVSEIHTHSTRSSSKLYIHTPRTVYALKTVRYQAPLAWNLLSNSICASKTIHTFKRKTSNYLLHLYELKNLDQ